MGPPEGLADGPADPGRDQVHARTREREEGAEEVDLAPVCLHTLSLSCGLAGGVFIGTHL